MMLPLPARSLALMMVPLALCSQTAAAAGPEAGTGTGTETITARPDAHKRMTVPVRVGEQGPFHFLVDTGSEATVVSHDLARRLGITPEGRATLIGVAGSATVDTVKLDQIDLGTRSYYGLTAPLLEAQDMGADGILGLDSLQNQRVLLDFQRGLMAINDAGALGGNRGYEIVVTARRRQGQLIMADATIDGIKTQVVIDTGAESTIGNLALQKALARKQDQGSAMLTGVTGHVVEAQLGGGEG